MNPNEKYQYRPVEKIQVMPPQKPKIIDILKEGYQRPEGISSEAVDLLKEIVENAVFIGGGDFRISETYLEPAKKFLNNITD